MGTARNIAICPLAVLRPGTKYGAFVSFTCYAWRMLVCYRHSLDTNINKKEPTIW